MRRFFKKNRDIIYSGIIFFILSCGSIIGLSTQRMLGGPVKSFTATLASVAGTLLKLWDSTVIVTGTLVQSARFQIEIVSGCNGVYVTTLLVAAIIATPASWRRKLPGILVGATVVYVFNLVRLVSLFIIGTYTSMEVFDFFHVYIWQTLVVFIALAFFMGWIGTLPAPETGSDCADSGDDGEDVDPEHSDNTALDRSGSTI